MAEPNTEIRVSRSSPGRHFRRTLTRAIAYPAILLLFLIGVFLWQVDSLLRTTNLVAHSNEVITQASLIQKELVDMETGLRGFLLTDNPLFLEPYEIAQLDFNDNFDSLQTLVSDNPDQTTSLAELEIIITNWQQFATNTLAAAAVDRDLAMQLSGKQLMDSIRTQLAKFTTAEEQLRHERLESAQSTSQLVIISVIIGGLVVGSLLAVIIRQQLVVLSRGYEEALLNSNQRADEIFIQQEWLRGVLSSIGDAVIAADLAGKVTFMNRVAEQLTGWSAEEAAGKPLADVYGVVQEESAATSTLTRSKRLVGRTGSEIVVDDTTALVKDKHGKLIGNVVVFRDVTQRKMVEQERLSLIAMQAQYTNMLRQSNEQLQQFAYVASHDLQEPLRLVISYLQLVKDRYAASLDNDAREFIDYAVDGASRMKELITGLLTFARLETGEHEIYKEAVLQKVVNDVLTNLSVTITESGATVTHDSMPTIQADKLQMAQLFQNLIGNALKFHGKEPLQIHVSAEQKGNDWQFCVRDNGIGIAPEYQERIFRMFQRLHLRTEYAGTGIGLAICKKVVERHHGRIWVESELGKGAAFYFTLPARRNADAPAAASK